MTTTMLLLRLLTLASVIYSLGSSPLIRDRMNYLAINESSSSPSFRLIFRSAEKDGLVATRRVERGHQWKTLDDGIQFYSDDESHNNNYYDKYDDEDDDDDDDDEDDLIDDEDDSIPQQSQPVPVTVDLEDLNRNKPVRVLEFNDYISARNLSYNNLSSTSSNDILSNEDYQIQNRQAYHRFHIRIISKFILCTIYIVICLSCILGNILVILSVFTYRPLQSVQNIFIVSLALADTFVAVFVMPFHIIYQITDGKWLFGTLVCHFFLLLDILLCTSSTLHLCCIALDRYWAIKDSIRYAQKRTMRRVLIMIFVTWFLSLVISLPVVIWNTKTVRSVSETTESSTTVAVTASSEIVCDIPTDKLYRFYSSSGTFFLPLIVMTFVYVRIYLETKRRLRERAKTAQKLAKSMAQGAEQTPLTRTASVKSSAGSIATQCLSRICCFDLFAKLFAANEPNLSHGAKNAKIGPKNEKKVKISNTNGSNSNKSGKKRSTIKKVIINEINGDTGEKIQTHHQRIISSTQESSYMTRECSYVSLNRSIQESEQAQSPESSKTPPQQDQDEPCEEHQSEVIVNPPSNVVVLVNVPVFRLEVDEPTKSQDADENFVDAIEKDDSESAEKLVEKRSVGTYTKSRKSSKLCPNYAFEETPNATGTETKTTINTTSSCSLGSKQPSIRSGVGVHASSWIKENAGAGMTLKERQKISLTRERRAARTMGIIMGAFTVCWMPFFVLYLLQSFHLFLESPRLFEFVTWLGYVNSALNPIIYTIFNLDFRKSFERLLSKCFSCRPRRQLSTRR